MVAARVCFTCSMSSIISKKMGGHTYYYLVESARVGGKPRIVAQRYLGRAADIEVRGPRLVSQCQ